MSILESIKTLLSIERDFLGFDDEIIMHVNSAFFTLNQIGVGPKSGFSIIDSSKEWKDFLGEREDLEAVKTYIYLKVRLIWDPPQMGYLVEAINEQIKQLEWRLLIQGESNEEGE